MNKPHYHDMRFLIVDNIKPSQDILKQFVMRSTSKPVDSTHYAQDVATICQQKDYDVILLGYDLGDNQKNGQQILEELRVNNYISRQCVVILITAEVSQGMVLAALEHKPDHYLCKPYSLHELNRRLTECLNKKNKMREIYQALDGNQQVLVIQKCKEIIDSVPKYRAECLGIISRQYFEMGMYDNAKSIYVSQHNKINCQWATIGLGKVALKEKDLDTAEKLFKRLINQDPLYLSSYDWLATTYKEQFKFILAEEILEEALKLSPRSLERLQRYAELCIQNENFYKATVAYENNYKFAHNSIHHSPDNAINYVNAVIEHSPSLPQVETKKINNKAFAFLKQMTRDFKTSDIKIHSHFLGACLFEINNQNELANEEIIKGEKLLITAQDHISQERLIQISKTLVKLQKVDLATELVKLGEQRHMGTVTDSDQLNVTSKRDRAQDDIEQALSLYSRQQYHQAIMKLEGALKTFPDHTGIKLNLIQVLLVSYTKKEENTALLQKVKNYLEGGSWNDLEQGESLRLEKLQKKYQQLAGI